MSKLDILYIWISGFSLGGKKKVWSNTGARIPAWQQMEPLEGCVPYNSPLFPILIQQLDQLLLHSVPNLVPIGL